MTAFRTMPRSLARRRCGHLSSVFCDFRNLGDSPEIDILQDGVLFAGYLILNEASARRAKELPELHGVSDKPLRIADQRARALNRPVDAPAVLLVVLAGRSQRLPATRAAEPLRTIAIQQVQVDRDGAQ